MQCSIGSAAAGLLGALRSHRGTCPLRRTPTWTHSHFGAFPLRPRVRGALFVLLEIVHQEDVRTSHVQPHLRRLPQLPQMLCSVVTCCVVHCSVEVSARDACLHVVCCVVFRCMCTAVACGVLHVASCIVGCNRSPKPSPLRSCLLVGRSPLLCLVSLQEYCEYSGLCLKYARSLPMRHSAHAKP